MTHLINTEFDHYISHCNNDNCRSKEECYRYKAHIELVKMGLTDKPYTYIEQSDEMDNCLAFIRGKEQE